nr:hypothetical protein [Escherichia coli]
MRNSFSYRGHREGTPVVPVPRCLWAVHRVRRARDGRFYRSRLASVTVYASPSPFSDERPSSRFRGITLPSERRRLRYSTVGLTRYRTR